MVAASPVPKLREAPPTTRQSQAGFISSTGGNFSIGNFNPIPSASGKVPPSLSGWGNLPRGFPSDQRGLLVALATLLTSGSFGGGGAVAGPPIQSPLVGGVFTDPNKPYNLAPNAYQHPLTAVADNRVSSLPAGAYGNQDPGDLWRRLQAVHDKALNKARLAAAHSARERQLEANRQRDNAAVGTYIGAGLGAVVGTIISPGTGSLVGAGIGGGLGKILGGLF